MTPQKRWPNEAADDRDKAAEMINQAAEKLEQVTEKVPPEVAVTVSSAVIDMHKSLRLLERQGAKTTVPETKFVFQ